MLAEKLSGAVGNAANPTYIEDVFSTYLYTGTGATQNIVNGIDLSGKGGLTWLKYRTNPGSYYNHQLVDTVRGANQALFSNLTDAQFTTTNGLNSFNSDGFTVGSNMSQSTYPVASWTFRKQPKFFDVVTYTGTGSNRTVAHNLGSTPGVIIIKQTSASGRGWITYHRSIGPTGYLDLSQTNATDTWSIVWNNTAPTSTEFTVGTFAGVNESGASYVAYIFAHDAGGFGLTGTDNVISCGSYTGNGSTTGPIINLGYEPQWILIKRTDTSGQYWCMWDNMRGIVTGGNDPVLYPNVSDAENTGSEYLEVNATGFQLKNTFTAINASGSTYIYIAIRRGPMKVPTDGTKVFSPQVATGATGGVTMTSNFPVDLVIDNWRAGDSHYFFDRLRSNYGNNWLITNSTGAEGSSATNYMKFDSNTGVLNNDWAGFTGYSVVSHLFRRAPSFFDEVCYTGTGSATTVTHNLGVAPTFWIVKKRSASESWVVGYASGGANAYLTLQTTDATASDSGVLWNNALPTSTVLNLSSSTPVNGSGSTYVAYLFATCAGVSKVGSYTGNGSSQTINCGFTGGARFVLIKRTDSTGDWYVWDTARGIVSGNDPHLSLNTTSAEVTTDDTIDPDSTGFIVNQLSATNVNVSSATYIYLAIA